jgi:hypothetical protein
VKAVFDAADPVRLLASGSPPDEYELEIQEIVSRIDSGEALSADAISELLTRRFGEETTVNDSAPEAIAQGLAAFTEPDA